jgi:hypothetical protein
MYPARTKASYRINFLSSCNKQYSTSGVIQGGGFSDCLRSTAQSNGFEIAEYFCDRLL